jgi:hypothetical protein
MAWTKFWDGLWYNDTTGEQRATFGDPNQEDAAKMATQPTWIQEGWQVVSGDPSGSGVSQTAVINPATGKAETLIEVASAPDANGIRQSLGSMPYSEFVAARQSDPTITVARSTPSPENSMLQSSLGSQIMDGIKEVGPIALAMAMPALMGPGGALASGSGSLGASGASAGYDLGMGGMINPAVEAASGYGSMGSLGSLGVPSGSMVNLANSATFMPAAGSALGGVASSPSLAGFNTPSAPLDFGPSALDASSFSTGSPTNAALNNGGEMNFFDELLGLNDVDMTGFQTGDLLDSAGSTWDTGFNQSVTDSLNQYLTPVNNGLVPDGFTVDLANSANLIPSGGGVTNSLWDSVKNLYSTGKNAVGAVNALTGQAGTPQKPSAGKGILDQFTSDPGGAAFNSLPFLLAAATAKSQRDDVKPYLDNLDTLMNDFKGNNSAFLKSLTNPYDQQQSAARGELILGQGLRGLGGSSFADQSLQNFDTMSGLGRADILSKGTVNSTGVLSGLNTNAMQGINARNTSTNALLGAGLAASGNMFKPQNSVDDFVKRLLAGNPA